MLLCLSTNTSVFLPGLSLSYRWDAKRLVRRTAFVVFGVPGTEANPDFVADVAAAAPNKNGGVILVCNIGGRWGARGGV